MLNENKRHPCKKTRNPSPYHFILASRNRPFSSRSVTKTRGGLGLAPASNQRPSGAREAAADRGAPAIPSVCSGNPGELAAARGQTLACVRLCSAGSLRHAGAPWWVDGGARADPGVHAAVPGGFMATRGRPLAGSRWCARPPACAAVRGRFLARSRRRTAAH